VLKNGCDLINEEEDNRSRPIVLFIVYLKNGEYDCSAGSEPTHSHGIAARGYPTYSFSKVGYKMLLKEHKYHYKSHNCNIIPYWIRYVRKDKIKYGCDSKHIKDVDLTMHYTDKTMKQKNVEENEKFLKNPTKYIKAMNATKAEYEG
jgi:hypothetical protein